MVEAFDWFDARLGPEWHGWALGYPFAAQFRITYNKQAAKGVRLRQLIGVLENGPALAEVISRVGSHKWEDYYTALTELEAAASLQTAGMQTDLVRRKTQRTPDFITRLAHRSVAFECTAVVQSNPERLANEVIDFLVGYPSFHRDRFHSSVNVRFNDGALADDAFQRLPELENALLEASTKKTRVVLPKLASVEPIPDNYGVGTVVVDGGLTTGSVLRSLIVLGRSIRGKLKNGQLDPAKPGVLFVRTRSFSFLGLNNLEDWLHWISEAALECLGDTKSQVSAVMVYERWRGKPDNSIHIEEPSYTAVTRFNEATETSRFVVLVRNPHALHPLKSEEISRLVGPSIPW